MTTKVLFLSHTGAVGGAELSLIDIARSRRHTSLVAMLADGPLCGRLRAAGVGVVIVAAAEALQAVRRGTRIPSLPVLGAVAQSAMRIARHARSYDVIYANSQKALTVGAAASVLSHRPLVWHLHDILSPAHFSSSNIRIAITLANSCATRVIANSMATANAFITAGGDREKVRVVYNGVDGEPYEAVANERAVRSRVRAAAGLDQNAPIIGVFGRLTRWKGQHVVLDAIAAMPGLHAVFVGAALFGDDAQYAAELRRRVAALEIEDRVHFLGFRDDVPALMSAVDIVVHSSTTPEPFGRVIVESMLAERPVIATRAGGALEIVEDGFTGVLVAPGDSAELATAIAALLKDPARAATIARNGRRCAESRFTLDSAIPAVERHIVEAAGGSTASTAKLARASSDRFPSHAATTREAPRL